MIPYASSDFEDEGGRDKKQREEDLLRGVLLRLGFSGFNIALQERPDAIVDLSGGNDTLRVACELQALHSDVDDQGSELRRFRGKWIRIMDRAFVTLQQDGTPIPYCVLDFLVPSYGSLDEIADAPLVKELVEAGRVLRSTPLLAFPQDHLPHLSSLVRAIRVIAVDGAGLRWWPSHLQSGEVARMDEAIVASVETKGRLAAGYDNWHETKERWLVLMALGHGLTDVIGHARPVVLPLPTEHYPFTLVVVWDRFSEDIWSVFPKYAVVCQGSKQRRDRTALPMAVQPFVRGGAHYPTKIKPT